MSQLRIALRTLDRHRGFSTVAILSLAIAIALNTTMYGVLEGLLRPRVAVRNVERVYELRFFGDSRRVLPPGAIEQALRSGLRSFEGVTGLLRYGGSEQPIAEAGDRFRRVKAAVVRTNFFDVLGTPPLQGRTLLPADQDGEAVIISHRLAQTLFQGEPAVGEPIVLDGKHHTVVGVVEGTPSYMPLSFDVWVPTNTDARPVPVSLIRLREQASVPAMDAELQVIASRLAIAAGDLPSDVAFRFKPLRIVVGLQWIHRGLIAAVAAILLVACANLANLQLARGLSRSRELALRSAVGASRGQLVRHLLAESALLASLGLALGLVLTIWGMHSIMAFVPPQMDGYVTVPRVSWSLFGFAALAGTVCLFLIGLLPAVQVSRVDPNSMLKAGSGTGANRQHRRRYGVLVIAQIAFALPLLIGAAIALKGALRFHDRDYFARQYWGYDAAPIVVAGIRLPLSAGTSPIVDLSDVSATLLAQSLSVAGIAEAAVSIDRPPVKRAVTVDDENGVLREVPAHGWAYTIVSPSYFRTFGRPMERGRDFAPGERDGDAVIMDAHTARFLWGNRNPIGRAVKLADRNSVARWHTVVGIVGDMRDTFAIRRRLPDANYRLYGIYRTITPDDTVGLTSGRHATLRLHARAAGNTELAVLRLQRALRELDPVTRPAVSPLIPGLSDSLISQDFVATLFGVFALVGLALVCIGVYGIVSHSIAERRRELAVRVSLGATTRDILRTVLREGNALLLAGIAVGLYMAGRTVWWLTFFMADGDAYNSLLFAAVAGALFLVVLVSALIPGWRATRIDPVEALRHE